MDDATAAEIKKIIDLLSRAEVPTMGKKGEADARTAVAEAKKRARDLLLHDTGPTNELPEGFGSRLVEALQHLGEGISWLTTELEPLAKKWQDNPFSPREAHALLGKVIAQDEVSHAFWRDQREEIKEMLISLVEHFGEAQAILGQTDGKMAHLLESMHESRTFRGLEDLRNHMVTEIDGFRDQANHLRQRVEVSHSAVNRSRQRIQRLERALRESRDEALQDVALNIPNRYAFGAHMQRLHERATLLDEPFSLVVLNLNDWNGLQQTLGEERAYKVVKAWLVRVRSVLRQGDYVARLAPDRLGLLFPGSTLERTARKAQRMAEISKRTRFVLDGQPVVVVAGFGVVMFEKGIGEEEMISHGETLAAQALAAGGNRVAGAPPEDEQATPLKEMQRDLSADEES